MKNFYVADLHFGHENIMKHSHRPFSSIEEMDKALIQNWNNAVSDNDTVYILGDFCFRSGKQPEEYLKKLNGKKIFILGNHDKDIRRNPKMHGLEKVADYLEISDTLDNTPKMVVLSHYPMIEWNGYFRDSIHLYGHIHNNVQNDAYKIMKTVKNAYNVGVDILDYTPRTLAEVIKYNDSFNKRN